MARYTPSIIDDSLNTCPNLPNTSRLLGKTLEKPRLALRESQVVQAKGEEKNSETRKKEKERNYLASTLNSPKNLSKPHASSRFVCAKLKKDERGREKEEETRETSKKLLI